MNLLSKRDLKLFLKNGILEFAGSVFKDFSLKTSRQAPAATAWKKKKKTNKIKNNTKVKKNKRKQNQKKEEQIKDKNNSKI